MRAAVLIRGGYFFIVTTLQSPEKWHLKLFEVSDARAGYVIAFDVYMGKKRTRCSLNADVLNPDSTQTTKVIVGLMQKGNLLGRGHHVYMDNYYTSPDLFLQLHSKECFACGTCRKNRKKLPKAVTIVKLKKEWGLRFQKGWPFVVPKVAEKKRTCSC